MDDSSSDSTTRRGLRARRLKRARGDEQLLATLEAFRESQANTDPVVVLYGDLALLVAGFDLMERRYRSLGSFTIALAGASAVIAALSVQLIHPDPQSLTVAGFIVGAASFVLAVLSSLESALGNDDRLFRRLEVDPETLDRGMIETAMAVERLRIARLHGSVSTRAVLAAVVSFGMVVSLALMALGQAK